MSIQVSRLSTIQTENGERVCSWFFYGPDFSLEVVTAIDGLSSVRGERKWFTERLSPSPVLDPTKEYDLTFLLGCDVIRGRAIVRKVTVNSTRRGADCWFSFVSHGPVTPGEQCPPKLRRAIAGGAKP